MTLELKQTPPSVQELHEIIKQKLSGKYSCDIVHDRWSINLSGPKNCVLIKKSGMVGVGVFVNEKKNKVDVDGIVPNMVLERTIFGNFLTRLLLVSSWNKLEAEVVEAIQAKLS
jgi:hypothetical protein